MMERYDYFEAVRGDVADYIDNEIDLTEWRGNRDGLQEYLHDALWTCDSVTGNGSGSYTFSTWKAEENLCHNWDLLEEAAAEFCIEPKISVGYDFGPEYWDVTIRCYLLGIAISDVLDEIEADGGLDEEEEEETEEATA